MTYAPASEAAGLRPLLVGSRDKSLKAASVEEIIGTVKRLGGARAGIGDSSEGISSGARTS